MNATCRLPARLTGREATAVLHGLRADVSRLAVGAPLCVDASELQQFDSSALALLLDLRRTALSHGRNFSVQAMPPRLQELARLYGVAELV